MINIFHCLKEFQLRKVVIIKNDMHIQTSISINLVAAADRKDRRCLTVSSGT